MSTTGDAALLDAVERALTTVTRHANLPRFRARLLEASGVSLDAAAYPVLRQVAAFGSVRVGDLAQALAVDVSTVSRQVRLLESAGLIARRSDCADGRVSLVTLTGDGAGVMERVGMVRRSLLDEIMGHWSPEEQHVFGELLGRLAAGIVRCGEEA